MNYPSLRRVEWLIDQAEREARDSNDDGTETDRRTTATPSESQSRIKSVNCDRCSETVPLTQAITHGSVEDPDSNEVICARCIEPEDRIV